MKIPDVVIKTKDLELSEFIDYAQAVINNGLYEMRFFNGVPDWQANNGENGIYVSGSVRQLYFFLNGVWSSIGFNSLGTLVLFDKDGDTGITPEFTTDEDIIRFYTNGIYNYAMGTVGFAMVTGQPILFDGIAGDTKIVYDSASAYLRSYTDGVLRQEM